MGESAQFDLAVRSFVCLNERAGFRMQTKKVQTAERTDPGAAGRASRCAQRNYHAFGESAVNKEG